MARSTRYRFQDNGMQCHHKKALSTFKLMDTGASIVFKQCIFINAVNCTTKALGTGFNTHYGSDNHSMQEILYSTY